MRVFIFENYMKIELRSYIVVAETVEEARKFIVEHFVPSDPSRSAWLKEMIDSITPIQLEPSDTVGVCLYNAEVESIVRNGGEVVTRLDESSAG